MEYAAFREIRTDFTKIANEVQFSRKHYVLTKNNKPAVAIVPVEEAIMIEKILAHKEDLEDIKIYKSRKKEKATSIKKFWEEIGAI